MCLYFVWIFTFLFGLGFEYIAKFFLVVLVSGLVDVVWVKYFQTIADKRAIAAAFWGAVIYGMSGVTFISYKYDNTMVFAAMIGGFIGTYVTIKYSKK